MKRNSFYLCLAVALLLFAACAPAPEAPEAEITTEEEIVPTIEGVWAGDWGPNAADRNQVTVELNWDGETLTGIINPGPDAVELQNTSFDPDTGAIHLEAEVISRGGPLFHYLIDGILEEDTIKGSWSHDDVKGDFTITKQ